MSQNLWKLPSDVQLDSGRGANGSRERKQYEGFEGMNYEQRRQPYNPQQVANRNVDDVSDGGNNQRREEL